jgi:protein-tyrosine phosphatase
VDVLVVCTANIARSPLAEAMLRRRWSTPGAPDAPDAPDGEVVRVASAGTRARADSPPASGSVELARQRGLDITGHRSRPLTPDAVQGAGLVLTMSERQRAVCSKLATGAASRTFTFREFARLLDHLDRTGAVTVPATEDGEVAGRGRRLAALRDAAHRARASASRGPDPEDVADPIQKPWDEWLLLGDDLDVLIGRLGEALDRTA